MTPEQREAELFFRMMGIAFGWVIAAFFVVNRYPNPDDLITALLLAYGAVVFCGNIGDVIARFILWLITPPRIDND